MNEWPPKQNYMPPPISSRWQRELINLAGRAPNGLPHLRLEWGCTTTWTPDVKELKYLQRRDTVQTGWGIHVHDSEGRVVQTLHFGLKDSLPLPQPSHGKVFAITEDIEIGIPRFWISQYIPPDLVGNWEEARKRVLEKVGSHADMRGRPNQGMYYLGFHGIWEHDSGRKCCEEAKTYRRKCFGHYRDPSDLDLLYCSHLWKSMKDHHWKYDWTQSADAETMNNTLDRLLSRHEKEEQKDYEAMRLRIRDAFKSHRGEFTSRKGRDTFYIHRP